MEGITNKLKINDYTSLSQLKKKFKIYLDEQNCSEIKQSDFSKNLVYILVMLLEELLSDCLKLITKETNGLYVIDLLIFKNSLSDLNKYDFLNKYVQKYDNKIRYSDGIFFNIKKVFDSLESKYGEKLMINIETRNYISYLLLSLQYDMTHLCLLVIKFANKKTLNQNILMTMLSHYINDEILNKFKLKLESQKVTGGEIEDDKTDEIDDDDEVDIEETKNNVKQDD